MAKKISIGNMSSAIMGALEEYKEVTDEVVKNAVDSVSKEAKTSTCARPSATPSTVRTSWPAL